MSLHKGHDDAMEPEVDTARIAAEMKRQRYQHPHAAEALGLSRSGFSRKIRGERRFRFTELVNLAECLGVPVTELLPEPDVKADR